jgi:solute:Na+ symporter, SSS family
MSTIDWAVMLVTLLGIVIYGVWKTRKTDNVEDYLLGKRELKWWTIGLSIMATQASAITFLSTPGQAYEDGMGFAQFYFGLPVAMVIIAVFFLPIYYNLKVYTAYQYLEGRFGLATRSLTASLFLLCRGLSIGITILAPAIILSSIMGWNLALTNICIGTLVIFYTMMGGTTAVSQTQEQQMVVILAGIILAAILIVFKLPSDVSFLDAVSVAGKMEKLEVVDFSFDLDNKYTFWSGMLGGIFLFLSYFGTDQSQVQRYLSGKTLAESRLGLLFNGIIKVPMQFLVLFVGIMVFVFYQFEKPPVHFNSANVDKIKNSAYYADYQKLDQEYTKIFDDKQNEIRNLITAIHTEDESQIAAAKTRVLKAEDKENAIRGDVKAVISKANPSLETKDHDYIFITFVMNYMPIGLIGLLMAVIFSAAMSSIASELNALATTTTIDIYQRSIKKGATDKHYLNASKGFTILWGIIALVFALSASLFDNLIEAVNIVGSLFYGTILGIFLTAFFIKSVQGRAMFIASIISELIIIYLYYLIYTKVIEFSYLYLNLIGCLMVMLMAFTLQKVIKYLG